MELIEMPRKAVDKFTQRCALAKKVSDTVHVWKDDQLYCIILDKDGEVFVGGQWFFELNDAVEAAEIINKKVG